MLARLALESGKIFYGKSIGAQGTSQGETVFNTAMTGYQEVLTDPSYCGQIVAMTYPLMGNYGINPDDSESCRPYVRGFVAREACEFPSNWRSSENIFDYLQKNGVVAMAGIDTRELTRTIRQEGAMRAVITTEDCSDSELIRLAGEIPPISGQNLIGQVTTREAYTIEGCGPHVVVLDLGMKKSIAANLSRAGCKITVVPAGTSAEEIMELNPQGVMLSNGPGDPKDAGPVIGNIKKLIGNIPLFGICLGHQLLGLAMGADTYKLKFGHRGANHPVKDMETGKVQITSQNHSYAIDEAALSGLDITVTHRNLNDGTIEGMSHNKHPLFCVQYHPEAFPGPADSVHLFDRFLALMEAQ